MNITKQQIMDKPKKIGHLGDESVMETNTIGGWHIVFVMKKNGSTPTLGVGPNYSIARHVAKSQEPDLEITELAKHQEIPEVTLKAYMPFYMSTTTYIRKLGL